MPANKNANKIILVTGATGHQGGASLRHLRERRFPVRVLTRDPNQPKARALTGSGVEVVKGDMDDRSSLIRALEGVYGVHSVQNPHQAGIESEVRQGTNLADSAVRSSVSHFVYSSVASADQRTGIPHFESKFRIEEYIRGTGMRFTIVRPVFFMENWLAMRQGIDGGALNLPLNPTTRLQMIAVQDIGGVVAMAFEHQHKWQGHTIELAGDELSMTELVKVFTRVSGRDVRYVQIPWDEFKKQVGDEITLMYRWFEDVGYHVDISSMRQEYHGLTSFDQWMNSHWHSSAHTAH
jgi:uncharacterized protein YbjT (DUF2867 family)